MTMPRLSALADDFAERFNFEPTKVATLARALREAGMLSQKGRGNSAAQATALDAARLLIAMMLDSKMASAAADVSLVGSFKVIGEPISPVLSGSTLEAVAAQLIEYFGSHDVASINEQPYARQSATLRLMPYVGVAQISIFSAASKKSNERAATFIHPDVSDATSELPASYLEAMKRFPTGFYQEPELRTAELFAIGQVVADHKPLHWRAA